eukprot:CAMPEP_0202368954 /NCGR_PEP_ID=MMETSP1127-20130417/881_1 /ASSEMBLY_ACC=CAM_ASM_000462 /TAXON_ID=3047 /ORGANISM="Dunaliella tertiolecta, Strain CCMP1320" /LENGTH=42 /DNA_ID= /DNA_START= /DNA_END= /DNA_ORIENTATION=
MGIKDHSCGTQKKRVDVVDIAAAPINITLMDIVENPRLEPLP